MNNKLSILKNVCSKFNYKIILSGSFADYFWLNYQDVDDLDFLASYDFFDNFINSNYGKNILTEFNQIYVLKHRKESNRFLYRYMYMNHQIDFFVQDKDEQYQTVRVGNDHIMVESPDARLVSLIKNFDFKSGISKEIYHKQLSKIDKRIKLYKELLK
jgi:hypothetical protein